MKNKKFIFNKIDITSKKINSFFKKKQFDIVIHLAEQAGVRYSLINPEKYLNTNILGFSNLFESINSTKIESDLCIFKFCIWRYKKLSYKRKNITKPKNIYGYSKIINEHMADYYSKKMNIHLLT